MAELTLVEAVNLALHHEMEHDPNVVVLGEEWVITAAYSAQPSGSNKSMD